jgi:hypothetical protein
VSNLKKIEVEVKDGNIVLEGLQVGSYELLLKSAVVSVEVLEGKSWKGTSMIVTRDTLIEPRAERSKLVFREVTAKEVEEEVVVSAVVQTS